MAVDPQVVEHFFGVYLLYCKNPKYKGRTYIGYTVDPRRRIKQHNAGKDFGGAWKTSNRGPWEMVLIVHGFPNSTSALRFEWAWQHPELSRRLRGRAPRKKPRESAFEHKLRILAEMLNCGPWTRLPLTVRWLEEDFGRKYDSQLSPPLHMPIAYGKVASKKPTGLVQGKNKEGRELDRDTNDEVEEKMCSVCTGVVESDDWITCVRPSCNLIAHLICLGELFRRDGMILPVEGSCPVCETSVLWGDLIRKKIGCKMHLGDEEEDEDSEASDFSDD